MSEFFSHICKRLQSRTGPNPGVLTLRRSAPLFRLIATAVSCCLFETAVFPDFFRAHLAAQTFTVAPQPHISGTLLGLSPDFAPPMIKGLRINPHNPFEIDFMIDGNDPEDVSQEDAMRLVKYFFTIVTTPEADLWVNLSPAEKDRVMDDNLASTDMGRDMLLQDYLLKQLAASLTFPKDELGKKFWERVYQRAYDAGAGCDLPVARAVGKTLHLVEQARAVPEETGTAPFNACIQSAIESFSKVWIVPESATVYASSHSALILEAKLDVMTEEDYLASSGQRLANSEDDWLDRYPLSANRSVIQDIFRQIVIPEIKREINEGANFAPVRQMFHSLILGLWFKKNLKSNLINRIYGDRKIVAGIDIDDKNIREKVYESYLAAFKEGVYDFIQDEYDPETQSIVPRQYFSGGIKWVDMSFAGSGSRWLKTVDGQELLNPRFTTSFRAPAMLSVEIQPSENAGIVYDGLKGRALSFASKFFWIGLLALASACFSTKSIVPASRPNHHVVKSITKMQVVESLDAVVRDSMERKDNAQLAFVRNVFLGLIFFLALSGAQSGFSQSAAHASVSNSHRVEYYGKGGAIDSQNQDVVALVKKVVTVEDVKNLDGEVNALTGQAYDIDEDYFDDSGNWENLFKGGTIGWAEEVVIIAAQEKLGVNADGDLGPQTINALQEYVLSQQQIPDNGFSHSGGSEAAVIVLPSGFDGGAGSGGSGSGGDGSGVFADTSIHAAGGLATFKNKDDRAFTNDTAVVDFVFDETFFADSLVGISLQELPQTHRVITVGGQRFYAADWDNVLPDTIVAEVAVQAPKAVSKKFHEYKLSTGGLWTTEATINDEDKLGWAARPVTFLKYSGTFGGFVQAEVWGKLDGGVPWGEDGQKLKFHHGGQIAADLSKASFADKNGLWPMFVLMHYNDAGKYDPTGVIVGNSVKLGGGFTLKPQAGFFTVKDSAGIASVRAGYELTYKGGKDAKVTWSLVSDFSWPQDGDFDYYAGAGVKFGNTGIRLARGWSGTDANRVRYKGVSGVDRPAPGGLIQVEQGFGALKFKGWMGVNKEFKVSTVGLGLDVSGKNFGETKKDFAPVLRVENDFIRDGNGYISWGTTFAGLRYHNLTVGALNEFIFDGSEPAKLTGALNKPVLMAEINGIGLGKYLVFNGGVRGSAYNAGVGFSQPWTWTKNLSVVPAVNAWNISMIMPDGSTERDFTVSAEFPITANLTPNVTLTGTPSVFFYNGDIYVDGRVDMKTGKPVYFFVETGTEQKFAGPMGLQDSYAVRAGAGIKTKIGAAELYASSGERGAGFGIRTTANLQGSFAKAEPSGNFEQAVTVNESTTDWEGISSTLTVDSLQELGVVSVNALKVQALRPGMFMEAVWNSGPDSSRVEIRQIGVIEDIFVDAGSGDVAVKFRPVYTGDPEFMKDQPYVFFEGGAEDPVSALIPYSDAFGQIAAVYSNDLMKEEGTLSSSGVPADTIAFEDALAMTQNTAATSSTAIEVTYPAKTTTVTGSVSALDRWTTSVTGAADRSVESEDAPARGPNVDGYAGTQEEVSQDEDASNVGGHAGENPFDVTSRSESRSRADSNPPDSSEQLRRETVAADNKQTLWTFGVTALTFLLGFIFVNRQRGKARQYRSYFKTVAQLTSFTTELLTGKQYSPVTLFSVMPVPFHWSASSNKVGGVTAQPFPFIGQLEEHDGRMELHLIFQPDDVIKGWHLSPEQAERLPRAFQTGMMTVAANGETLKLLQSRAGPKFVTLIFDFPSETAGTEEIAIERPKSIDDLKGERVTNNIRIGMSGINKLYYHGEMLYEEGKEQDAVGNYDEKVFRHFEGYYEFFNRNHRNIFEDYGRTAEFADKVLRQAGDFLVADAESGEALLSERTRKMLMEFTAFARPLFEVVSKNTASIDAQKRVWFERGDTPHHKIRSWFGPLFEVLSLTTFWVAFYKRAVLKALPDVGFHKRRLDVMFGRQPDPHFTVARLTSGFYTLLNWWQDPNVRSMGGLDGATRLNRIFMDVFSMVMIGIGLAYAENMSWHGTLYILLTYLAARLLFPLFNVLTIPLPFVDGFYSLARKASDPFAGRLRQKRFSVDEMRAADEALFEMDDADRMLTHYSGIIAGESFHSIRVQPKRDGYEASMRSAGRLNVSQRIRIRTTLDRDLAEGVLAFDGVPAKDVQMNVHAFGVNFILPYSFIAQEKSEVMIRMNRDIAFAVAAERDSLTDLMNVLNGLDEDLNAGIVPEHFDAFEKSVENFYRNEIRDSVYRHHFRNNLAAYRKLRGKADHVRSKLNKLRSQKDSRAAQAAGKLESLSRHVYEVIRFYGEMASADVEKRLGHFRGTFWKLLRKITFIKYFVDRSVSQAYVAAENAATVGANPAFAAHLIKTNEKFDGKLLRPSPYIMLGEQWWRTLRRHVMMAAGVMAAVAALSGLVGNVFYAATQGHWNWYGVNLESIGGFYVMRQYFAVPLSGVYWVIKEYRQSLKGFLKNHVIGGRSGSLVGAVDSWMELVSYSAAIALPWLFPVLAIWQYVRYKIVDGDVKKEADASDPAQLTKSSSLPLETVHGGIDFNMNLDNIRIIEKVDPMDPAQLGPAPVINLQHFQQFRFKILGFKRMNENEALAQLGIAPQSTRVSYNVRPAFAGM